MEDYTMSLHSHAKFGPDQGRAPNFRIWLKLVWQFVGRFCLAWMTVYADQVLQPWALYW